MFVCGPFWSGTFLSEIGDYLHRFIIKINQNNAKNSKDPNNLLAENKKSKCNLRLNNPKGICFTENSTCHYLDLEHHITILNLELSCYLLFKAFLWITQMCVIHCVIHFVIQFQAIGLHTCVIRILLNVIHCNPLCNPTCVISELPLGGHKEITII